MLTAINSTWDAFVVRVFWMYVPIALLLLLCNVAGKAETQSVAQGYPLCVGDVCASDLVKVANLANLTSVMLAAQR